MPAQRQQSGLAARLGEKARRAFEEKREDAPEFDTAAGLPAGIEGGVARLVECKFTQIAAGKQNAGKDMFYAAGIVVSPAEINGVQLAGLRTQISEPLYDTPTRSRKTVEEHVEWVMNEFKKLGVDMSEMSIDDLESAAQALKEQRPFFRFRTWAGEETKVEERGGKFWVGTKGPYATEAAARAANPFVGRKAQTNSVWNGVCDHVADEEDAAAGVVDETEEAPSPPKKGKTAAKAPEPDEYEHRLAGLAEAADGGDQDAATQLAEAAKEAGVDEDAINSAVNWAAVLELMQAAGSDGGGAEPEPDDWAPEKGDVYPYKAPGKRKAVDCEVTAVFAKSETVNLKNLDDETTYKAVAWAKLER